MPRKVVGASCVAIVDFGEEGEAYNFMMNLDESVWQDFLCGYIVFKQDSASLPVQEQLRKHLGK